MTLCNAQEVTLCKKKAGLLTFLKLVATLWKQGEISGACSVNSFNATLPCPENMCMQRRSQHLQIRHSKQSSNGILESPIQAASRKRKIQKAKKELEIPVEPATPCVTQVRIPIAKTPTQKVAMSKDGGETPSI